MGTMYLFIVEYFTCKNPKLRDTIWKESQGGWMRW